MCVWGNPETLPPNETGMASYYIGTSGWHYPHWQGPFYPPDLAPADWLEYYARHFATVEINSSFYRLPSRTAAHAWKNATPAGFSFALKASRYITHMKKLRAPRTSLRAFLAVTPGTREQRRAAAVPAAAALALQSGTACGLSPGAAEKP